MSKLIYFEMKPLFTFVVFSLCSLLTSAKPVVDVNDVSYMWPPVIQRTDDAKLISLEKIIPQNLFQEIIGFAGGAQLQTRTLPAPVNVPPEVADIANWHIVSMRVDPCAPGRPLYRTYLSHCTQEIRFVAQPFSHDGVWEYYDFALHILFEISTGNPQNSTAFKNLLDQLLLLKSQNQSAGIDTTGLPLRVHPGFKLDSFRTGLHTTILSNLKNYTLKKVTFSGAESEEGPWVFFQGLVVNQHYRLQPDTSLHQQPFIQVKPEMPGQGGFLTPTPTNANWAGTGMTGFNPSIADLFYQGSIDLKKPAHLLANKESTVFKIEDLVFAFDNPNITDRTNTDCISCHASMSRGLLLGLSNQPNPFKYQAPNSHVSIKAILSSNLPTNFRTFGWFGSSPVISPRVINESASVANAIETLF